jgi:hypothetical protein
MHHGFASLFNPDRKKGSQTKEGGLPDALQCAEAVQQPPILDRGAAHQRHSSRERIQTQIDVIIEAEATTLLLK